MPNIDGHLFSCVDSSDGRHSCNTFLKTYRDRFCPYSSVPISIQKSVPRGATPEVSLTRLAVELSMRHAGGLSFRLNDGPDIKLFILVGWGRIFFYLLLGPPGFNCWFSFAPVFQWCCSTSQGSPGVGHNTLFLSSPHLCFIIVFNGDLFVSRDDPLMG